MIDVAFLDSHFCPPGCYPQFGQDEAAKLLGLIDRLAIKVTVFDQYIPKRDVSKITVKRRSDRESETHLALKQLATAWLLDEMRVSGEIFYEERGPAGIGDVICPVSCWTVECGGSRPSKIYNGLLVAPNWKIALINDLGVMTFEVGPRFDLYQQEHARLGIEMSAKVGWA